MSPMPQLTDSQKVFHQPPVGLVFLEAKAQEMENLEQLQHKLGKEKQKAVRLGFTAPCSARPNYPNPEGSLPDPPSLFTAVIENTWCVQLPGAGPRPSSWPW